MIKEKNVVLQVVFSILTLGLYAIYWQITLSNALVKASNGKNYNTSGIIALLLSMVTFGIYGWYWIYKMGQCAGTTKGNGNDGIIYLILSFFGLGLVVLILGQCDVNKVATK